MQYHSKTTMKFPSYMICFIKAADFWWFVNNLNFPQNIISSMSTAKDNRDPLIYYTILSAWLSQYYKITCSSIWGFWFDLVWNIIL